MKNWKQFTLMVFMALLVFTFIGCGDNDPPETCTCKNLHIVLTGEKCNKDGCVSVEISGQRVNGIPVTNRDEVASGLFNPQADIVGAALDYIGEHNPEQLVYIKANLKEINIVGGTGGIPTSEGYVLTINLGHTDGEIWNALDNWVLVI